jgi:hypothetical protein
VDDGAIEPLVVHPQANSGYASASLRVFVVNRSFVLLFHAENTLLPPVMEEGKSLQPGLRVG